MYQTTDYLRNRIFFQGQCTGSESLQLMAVVLGLSVKSVNSRLVFQVFPELLQQSKSPR